MVQINENIKAYKLHQDYVLYMSALWIAMLYIFSIYATIEFVL